jgi:lipase maturation factor 1
MQWLCEGLESHVTSAWIFLRLLGLTYAVAFTSLLVQIKGLAGRRGIVPVRESLGEIESILGRKRFWVAPTICWWKSDDRFLVALCRVGLVGSLFLMVGFAPVLVLIVLWLTYLSLFNVARPWLGYQWDVLLLEAGFLAIFLAPLRWTPEWPPATAPPRIVVWLLFWLLARLMFSSGAAKLISGEPTWRALTALKWHYETQPLPNPGAWWLHQMPLGFQRFSAVVMFGVELVIAPMMLLPPPFNYVGAAGTILLMLLIVISGNYGFFNLLTIVLAVFVFSYPLDQAVPHGWPAWVLLPVAALIIVLSIERMARLFRREIKNLSRVARLFEPLHLVNSYGLFSVMTTERLEIVVEGSHDGREWLAYEFKHKPGELRRRLPMVAPHQPRLDWQMWFAALSDYRTNAWFIALLIRLLQGERSVLRLLKGNPFPDAPPKYVRATTYQYWFTSRDERKQTGAIWKREKKWLYCPVYSLSGKEDRLTHFD